MVTISYMPDNANTLALSLIKLIYPKIYEQPVFWNFGFKDLNVFREVLINQMTLVLDEIWFDFNIKQKQNTIFNINTYINQFEMKKAIKKIEKNSIANSLIEDIDINGKANVSINIVIKKVGIFRKNYAIYMQILVT